MKKITAILATSLALIGAPSAFAQAAPAASATSAAPAAPAPVAVDPAATAAARELFESMNYRTVMIGAMQQMSQGIASSMRAGAIAAIENNPKATPEEKQAARVKMEAELPAVVSTMQGMLSDPTLVDEILAETVPIYARTFTADELKQITAFYRTPVGAKMLAAMPQLMREGMQLGEQIVVRRIGPMMQEMKQQAAKKQAEKK